MQIGAVAKSTGLTPDAIRFYERTALLPVATRTTGGFRQYGQNDLEALAFIQRVKALGFALAEIRELLELRRNRVQPCGPVRRRLQKKLLQVRRKLADLQNLERELRTALRSCDQEMRKLSPHCPLLKEANKRKPERAK